MGLGHYITINHHNGYQTTYAHLQENIFGTNTETWVKESQQIGTVGMSGNTSGPHLHFSVEKTNAPNPENRIDPFGWKNKFLKDHWEDYFWVDILGNHLGSKSLNLWKVDTKYNFLNNKQLILENNSSEHNFTIFIEPYFYPKVPITQNKLTYITGTSMLINAYNMLGQKIPKLIHPAKIEIDLSNSNLDNLLDNSLRVYKWDEKNKIWRALPSIYDATNKLITGFTSSFSKFAVFGLNKNTWKDKIEIKNVNLKSV